MATAIEAELFPLFPDLHCQRYIIHTTAAMNRVATYLHRCEVTLFPATDFFYFFSH